METTKQTSKEYFRTLTIIHFALTLGIVFAGMIAAFLVLSGAMMNDQTDLNKILSYIVPGVSIGGLFLSQLIYKSKISELKGKNDLSLKMTNYRGIFIIRFAIIEASAFFAFVAAFVTGNLQFLAYVFLIILMMIYWRPTRNSVIADLELNPFDSATIRNPDSSIAEFANSNSH